MHTNITRELLDEIDSRCPKADAYEILGQLRDDLQSRMRRYATRWRMNEMTEWKPCDQCSDPMDCGSWQSCHNPGRTLSPAAAAAVYELDRAALDGCKNGILCRYPNCVGWECSIVTKPSTEKEHNIAVQFEQLLSHRPHGQNINVRDAIFDYFCKMLKDTDRANAATKQFTDQLYSLFSKQK